MANKKKKLYNVFVNNLFIINKISKATKLSVSENPGSKSNV